ncbi:MAG: thioredoxin family protein [Verrucomicrobia bacterium]|nr:thioredoxin family protein [Verrucomicrobiota bacterium]MCH8526522.1 thioredoxin family protein [Kiritimatiellia bacterium]
MKKKLMQILAVAGLSLGIATAHADAAPAFTLPDGHGNEHSLSDFEGKIVVLEWVNHGCPFVVKFYRDGHMQALQAEMAEKGVIWLSICSSAPGTQGWKSAEDQLSTIEEKEINAHAVLIDEDGTVGRAFGARTTPHMFVIDTEGNIAYQGAIDSVRSTNPADIPEARNYVREAVAALLAGEPVPVAQTQPYGCSVKYN